MPSCRREKSSESLQCDNTAPQPHRRGASRWGWGIHGIWTEQAGGCPPELALMSSRFASIPLTIGEWKGIEFDLPSGKRHRPERWDAWHDVIPEFLPWGFRLGPLALRRLPGDISTHTPDVCYPGAGYALNMPVPLRQDRMILNKSQANFRNCPGCARRNQSVHVAHLLELEFLKGLGRA